MALVAYLAAGAVLAVRLQWHAQRETQSVSKENNNNRNNTKYAFLVQRVVNLTVLDVCASL